MLELGEPHTLSMRTVSFSPFGNVSPRRILYVSDLHLKSTSQALINALHRVVQEAKPHLVLLGGDIVDNRSGMVNIIPCVKPITALCPVWAIPGNHDEYAGCQLVRQQVEAAGGQWLENRTITFPCGVGSLRIDAVPTPQHDPVTFTILCAHYPSVFPVAAAANYDLVLAGHLHGSQFVLARRRARLYPGAWFYRWNGDIFTHGKSTMLVSRGANDTIPIRWNCPREVILCQIF